jgi:hypothetical protein
MHNAYAAWYYVRTIEFTDFPEPYIQILSYIKEEMNKKGIYGK